MAHYEIVYVARTPQESGNPTLTELGPIYGDLTWTENLYVPDSIEVTAPTNELEDDLKSRLRDLVNFPTEIWVYRDGDLIQAGPIMGGTIDDKTITLSASGIEAYLKYMLIINDQSYTDKDQASIVQDLISDWQDLSYGDFAIHIDSVLFHGVTRTKSYNGFDLNNLYDVIEDLGAADDGFDFWVDPATREFEFGHPTRGSDLSETVFLERGIASPNIKFSVAPGIVASEFYGTAKDSDGDPIRASAHSNTTVRPVFGRTGYADTYEDGEFSFLQAQVTAAREVRRTPLFHPGPSLIPVDGAEAMDFGPGDEVHYLYDAGLGQQSGVFRVKKKKVSVDKQENIEVEFE